MLKLTMSQLQKPQQQSDSIKQLNKGSKQDRNQVLLIKRSDYEIQQ